MRRGNTGGAERCVRTRALSRTCSPIANVDGPAPVLLPGFPALPPPGECESQLGYRAMMDEMDRAFSSLPGWQPPDDLCERLALTHRRYLARVPC